MNLKSKEGWHMEEIASVINPFLWTFNLVSMEPSFIGDLEKGLFEVFVDWFGLEGAVMTEHLMLIVFSFILGFLLCIFVRAMTYQINTDTRVRFSNELNDLLFVKIEKEPVTEIIFRYPRNIKERIELYLAFVFIKRLADSNISEKKVRGISTIFFILLFIMSIAVTFIILFTINVSSVDFHSR